MSHPSRFEADDPYLARLREAFKQAVASAEFKAVTDKLDAPLLYLDGPDYEQYVNTVYQKETVLIDKLKLREQFPKCDTHILTCDTEGAQIEYL